MPSKILVVDDNVKNINIIKLLLSDAGCLVVTAMNGADGLKIARSELPDLILMDIQMPEMDGFDAAHAILTDAATCKIPIIGISAYASPGTRERAIRLGMQGFFEKPINRDRFVSEVRAFLPVTSVKEKLP